LKAVPVFLHCEGQFDIDWKMYVAGRDGVIYTFRNGQQMDQIIQIESKPIGFLRLEKTLLIAGMDNIIQSFYMKGKKNFAVTMPSEVLAITKMNTHKTTKAQSNYLVALKNGEIRMYNDKHLICKITTDDLVTGMLFGVFGREEGCLVINHKSGGL